MFWQKEPKNLKLIILIIILCLVTGTIFFIYGGKPQKLSKEEKLPSEIEVIEQGTGKIVRNIKEGYEVTIPKDWTIDFSKTQFYSPEYMSGKGNCQASMNVITKKTSIEDLKRELIKEHKEWYSIIEDKYEILEIAGYKALKNIFHAEGEGGYSINIYIPIGDKLYSIGGGTLSSDIEKCKHYIENILKTVLINKF